MKDFKRDFFSLLDFHKNILSLVSFFLFTQLLGRPSSPSSSAAALLLLSSGDFVVVVFLLRLLLELSPAYSFSSPFPPSSLALQADRKRKKDSTRSRKGKVLFRTELGMFSVNFFLKKG